MLRCPVCTRKDMAVLELAGVEIDYCFSCKGIWLDRGELETFIGAGETAHTPTLSFTDVSVHCREKKRRCPICNAKMVKVEVALSEEKVLLDRCPRNHGFWFDDGELRKVVEGTGADASGNPVVGLLRDMFGTTQEK